LITSLLAKWQSFFDGIANVGVGAAAARLPLINSLICPRVCARPSLAKPTAEQICPGVQ